MTFKEFYEERHNIPWSQLESSELAAMLDTLDEYLSRRLAAMAQRLVDGRYK